MSIQQQMRTPGGGTRPTWRLRGRFVRWCNLCSLVITALVWIAASTHVTTAAELRIERLFGPETRTGPYKHPARIEELKNGDLYLVYYGGAGEYATDTGVFGSR